MGGAAVEARHARLAELCCQIQSIKQQIHAHPIGTPEWEALVDRCGQVAAWECSIREELQL